MMAGPGSLKSRSTPDQKYKITHVIFDVDGLIPCYAPQRSLCTSRSNLDPGLDTERVYTESLEEICADYGHSFTWEIKAQQMGKKERDSAKLLIDALQLPISVDGYLQKLKEKLEEKLPTVGLLPGAEKLIRHLHKKEIPIALATGSDKWGYTRKIAGHKELFSLFHHCVLSSDDPDVAHGKPAPDCFLVAAQRFQDSPQVEEVLVFEDAANGAEAGLAAGMKVVWVPDPRADRSLLQDRVSLVLDSLEQFRPEDFGLPVYDDGQS